MSLEIWDISYRKLATFCQSGTPKHNIYLIHVTIGLIVHSVEHNGTPDGRFSHPIYLTHLKVCQNAYLWKLCSYFTDPFDFVLKKTTRVLLMNPALPCMLIAREPIDRLGTIIDSESQLYKMSDYVQWVAMAILIVYWFNV